ncbi:MAG: hypothetical protein IJ519_01115 [Clostridia bacterium]|nr:hypothetical protein [Clostridia bacterium]
MKKVLHILSFIKHKLIHPASLYTVLIGVVFMLIAMEDIEPSITLGIFASIFAFSLVLAAAKMLLDLNKLNVVLRYVLHYVITMISFIGFWQMCYPRSVGARSDEQQLLTGKFIWDINPRLFIYGLCFFTVAYLILIGIGAATRATKTTETQDEEDYENIF